MFSYNPITTIFLGPLQINIWGLLVAAGFVVGIALALNRAKKENIDLKHIWNIALISVICGIAGARILYALENISHFIQSPLEIFDLSTGGLSYFGGFLLSFFGIWIYIKKSKDIKKTPLEIFDLLIPALLIGMVFGRVGCFLAHDHLGRLMPHPYFWGVVMNGKVYHDPALYLLVTNLALFLIFLYLRDKIKEEGIQTVIFLFALSFLRLGWDYFRDDPRYFYLTVAQWMGITLIISVFIKGWMCYKKNC